MCGRCHYYALCATQGLDSVSLPCRCLIKKSNLNVFQLYGAFWLEKKTLVEIFKSKICCFLITSKQCSAAIWLIAALPRRLSIYPKHQTFTCTDNGKYDVRSYFSRLYSHLYEIDTAGVARFSPPSAAFSLISYWLFLNHQ